MAEHKLEIEVRMLGRFEISGGGRFLGMGETRSDRIMTLAGYLFLHHQREVFFDDLVEVLWGDAEVKDPKSALKNLMYRLRTALQKVWPEVEFWITGAGCYIWNPQIGLTIDVEMIEEMDQRLERSNCPQELLDTLRRIMELYRGRLLNGLHNERWLDYLQWHYHNRYIKYISQLCGMLQVQGEWTQIEEYCQRAIHLDSGGEELLHCWLLKAYLAEGRKKEAEEYYWGLIDTLYEGNEDSAGEELRSLALDILSSMNERVVTLEEVVQKLPLREQESGAFFCSYSTFREVYVLTRRKGKRSEQASTLVLLTVRMDPSKNAARDEGGQLPYIMQKLQEVICSNLRMNDVVSRYNASQFLLLAFGCDEQQAATMMKRVYDRFYTNDWRRKNVNLEFTRRGI